MNTDTRSDPGSSDVGAIAIALASFVADPAIAYVARESSPVCVRDERFAADADRVDRIRGDRFGDGANRSRASQLTRATPAILREPIMRTAEPRRSTGPEESAGA
jgi:hypothetical protein